MKPRPLILIGHPRLPKGPAELACQICKHVFPAMQSTVDLLEQLAADNKMTDVECWYCAHGRPPDIAAIVAVQQEVGDLLGRRL